MALRVIHCGTGVVGRHALEAITVDPALELVGMYVSSPDKIGRDAGELCGMPPVGIAATSDLDSLVGLNADCLAYFGNGIGREDDAVADLCRFLENGCNVVSCSLLALVYPPAGPPQQVAAVTAACERGRSSVFITGLDPGYATTGLALSALTLAGDVECVRMQELGDISKYAVAWVMRDMFGFGQPLDYNSPLQALGVIKVWWEGTLVAITDVLGREIDEYEITWETAGLDCDVQTSFGTVAAGTIAAIRFQLIGKTNGKPVAVLEHVDRIDRAAGPQWAAPATDADLAYRVTVTGKPNFAVELSFPYEDGARCTALHATNAIRQVVTAEPGFVQPSEVVARPLASVS